MRHFGAIDYRLSYTIEIIQKYLDGSIPKILELEEEVLGGMNKTWSTKNDYMYVN